MPLRADFPDGLARLQPAERRDQDLSGDGSDAERHDKAENVCHLVKTSRSSFSWVPRRVLRAWASLYYTTPAGKFPAFPGTAPVFQSIPPRFPAHPEEGHPLDLLNSLMPLPRQHDHIPGPPLGQSPANGLPPVRLHMDLPAGAAHSGQNILDDGPGMPRSWGCQR